MPLHASSALILNIASLAPRALINSIFGSCSFPFFFMPMSASFSLLRAQSLVEVCDWLDLCRHQPSTTVFKKPGNILFNCLRGVQEKQKVLSLISSFFGRATPSKSIRISKGQRFPLMDVCETISKSAPILRSFYTSRDFLISSSCPQML